MDRLRFATVALALGCFSGLSLTACGQSADDTATVPAGIPADTAEGKLDEITRNHQRCIEDEIVASTENGVLDELFFAEGKEHCDGMRAIEKSIVDSQDRITAMSDEMIDEVKAEKGL